MSRLRLSALLLLACALLPAAARAGRFEPPTLMRALHSIDSATIPASWSGVWVSTDSIYGCSPHVLQSTSTSQDTLCTGATLQPDTTGGFSYSCTGTVTDTEVHLSCTGSFTFEGCTGNFTSVIDGTRSGDTTVTTTTFTTSWSPPFCAFQADSCDVTVSRSTRVAPQPASCNTPVHQGTWGSLKVRYR